MALCPRRGERHGSQVHGQEQGDPGDSVPPRILYAENMSFRTGQIQTFSDKNKTANLSPVDFQEMLSFILQAEGLLHQIETPKNGEHRKC